MLDEVALLLLSMSGGVSVPSTDTVVEVASASLTGTFGGAIAVTIVTWDGFALAESKTLSSFEIKRLVNYAAIITMASCLSHVKTKTSRAARPSPLIMNFVYTVQDLRSWKFTR